MNPRPGALAATMATFFAVVSLAGPGPVVRAARPPQAWLARRFLLQVLANRPRAAYAALAPGARARVSETQFAAQAGQLRRQARRWGPAIELYKLGWRLPEGQPAVLFYQFVFAKDSAKPGPHVLLDVTFGDSLATGPSGFGLVLRRRP